MDKFNLKDVNQICIICGTWMDNNHTIHYVNPCDLDELIDHDWVTALTFYQSKLKNE